MSYLLLRDAVLVLTFALSWIFFQPHLLGVAMPGEPPPDESSLLARHTAHEHS
jgi:hypothetical protein